MLLQGDQLAPVQLLSQMDQLRVEDLFVNLGAKLLILAYVYSVFIRDTQNRTGEVGEADGVLSPLSLVVQVVMQIELD